MKLAFTKITSVFLLLTLSSSVVVAADDVELVKTWENARVYESGSFFSKKLRNFETMKSYPVVLYFHGCAGITSTHDVPWAKLLASRGFLVVMPDSFSRKGKVVECDAATTKRPSISDLYLRIDEVNYALRRLKDYPWFSGTVFMMGHSQGAAALARVDSENVNGFVLSSLVSCQLPPNISKSVPVLRIGYSNDPWNNISPAVCDAHFVHENFTMKILDGREHGTFDSHEFRTLVLEFLDKRITR
jgi:dienelactone hydrolase